MCGRFSMFVSDDDLVRIFGIDVQEGEYHGSYNQAPSLPVRAVIGDRPRILTLQQWGLIPSWARPGFTPLINARAETVTEKPSFRAAAMRRRCLIPANGYFEWVAEAGRKQPYFLSASSGELLEAPILAMAGISEVWHAPGGEEVHTCAIITREAADNLGHIHPRMPLFVPPEAWDDWLDPETQDRRQVRMLIESLPPAELRATPVSAAVGNVRTQDPSAIFGQQK